MRTGLVLLAAGFLGCEIYSSPNPMDCPGELVATFYFSTPPDGGPATSGSTCPFASTNQVAQSLSFTAALHASPDGGAALCRTSGHARPLLGTFQADQLAVSVADTGGGTPACGCPLLVVEQVTGSVQRDGGIPVSFTGDLTDSISPADGSALDGGACGCGLPCVIRYAPLVGSATAG